MDIDSTLGDLFLKEELSDVRVIVENETEEANFPAHSLVLKRRSPVIAKMLDSDLIEGQTKRIVITDLKIIHIEMFLKFLYMGTLPKTYTRLCKLLKIADKYLVSELTERCVESLLDFLNLENVYELCHLAETYSLEKLLDKCLFWIKRTAFTLLQCDDLKNLSKELMEKIVSDNSLNIQNEIDVFWVIWRWGNLKLHGVEFSNENVVEYVEDLLKHVRWSLIDESKEKVFSLGIKVADADLQKQYECRKPTSADKLWFFNHCDILCLNDYASSCKLQKQNFKPTVEVNLMRAVSFNELPVYVVGVLFACTKQANHLRAKLTCSCESSSSIVEIHYQTEKYMAITDTNGATLMDYQELKYEFPKPIEVRKNQKLTISMVSETQFGTVELQFGDDGKSVYSNKRKAFYVHGNVLGIKNVFLL